MKNTRHISILGGGPAGLAIGHYAKKSSFPFTLYEASSQVGGNAKTLQHRDFLFDTGAHRWHDKYPDITQDMLKLLGPDVAKIHVPSQIFYNGKFIDFPLSPLNLLVSLGLGKCLRAGVEILANMLRNKTPDESFESFAVQTYGRTIAGVFLLNYSEKLWGRPCRLLSPSISGKRLKGLNLKTFLKEIFQGSKSKTEHLDGSFYYPVKGIGMISERIAEFCGEDNIRVNSRVTRIFHNQERIQAIEINGSERIEITDDVACTLPLPLLIHLMEPAPPEELVALSRSLFFRNLILAGVFLDRNLITPNASVYFPTSDFIFSRVYEPKNRSLQMSPEGKTSLMAEIPCSPNDDTWNMTDEEVAEKVCSQFAKIGWGRPHEIIDTAVLRFPYAYPILEMGFEDKVFTILEFLKRFGNLKLSGRNGEFKYIHIHDLMKMGKDLVHEISISPAPPETVAV